MGARIRDSGREFFKMLKILPLSSQFMRTTVAQWLGYCARNQKVTGSIPDGVIGILH
jgi:hypothetical protein